MAYLFSYASTGPYKETGSERTHRRSEKGVVACWQTQFPDKSWIVVSEIGRSQINKSMKL